jgi:SAM-dependent methyltransferase
MQDEIADLIAAGYDTVYEALGRSPTFERIWREHACGTDYPWEFGHVSFVTTADLAQMSKELRLEPGDVFADIACGAGGPGLWVCRQTGAHLEGRDISSRGLEAARERARALGLADRANFAVGSFGETGLNDASMSGVMSNDALQYAADKRAAVAEAARVLGDNGRLVFTAFELDPARASELPVLGSDPTADFAPLLESEGFSVDVYEETPDWEHRLMGAYRSLMDEADALRRELGEPAFAALEGEVSLTLQQRPYRRRVLVAATKR